MGCSSEVMLGCSGGGDAGSGSGDSARGRAEQKDMLQTSLYKLKIQTDYEIKRNEN